MRIMELTLNLIWAAIAAASYALLFRRLVIRDPGNARGLNRSQCIIALTCVLAILFPVISLTDDLHEMQATAEEASPSGLVMKKCVASHSTTPAQSLHQAARIFTPFAMDARWAVLGVVAAQQIQHPFPGVHLSPFGRAPPSFAIPQIS
jgi:hypothetical protein